MVNPVVTWPLQSVLRLRGEWEFVTPETAPLRHPGWSAFLCQALAGSPRHSGSGVLGVAGRGDAGHGRFLGLQVGSLRQAVALDLQGRRLVSQNRHLTRGRGAGQRIWLKVGGVRSQGWFWVNQTPVAWVDNYCGAYKYDITDLVEAGSQAVVVAEVNNVVPSRKGLFSSTHRFGGLYRDVELEATPDGRIDYAWVRGDFDRQAAEVHATVAYGNPVAY